MIAPEIEESSSSSPRFLDNNSNNSSNNKKTDDETRNPPCSSFLLLHNAQIVTCGPLNLESATLENPPLLTYSWLVADRNETSGGRILEVDSPSNPEFSQKRLEYWKERAMSSNDNNNNSKQHFIMIDGNNKVVLPGLIDSHCHAYALGHLASKVADLSHSKTIEEMTWRLKQQLDSIIRQQGQLRNYLEGVQWDDEEMGGMYPSRHDLDQHVTRKYPVITYRRCWHVCCVNSKALEMCKIHSKEQDPGVDVDERTGEPTGILRENAMTLLGPLLEREDTRAEKIKYSLLALEQFARCGVTSVQTNDTQCMGRISDAWTIYGEVLRSRTTTTTTKAADSNVEEEKEEGDNDSSANNLLKAPLPCRVFLTTQWSELDGPQAQRSSANSAYPDFLSNDRTKLVMDGALGPSTAAVTEAYSDAKDPGSNEAFGMLELKLKDCRKACRKAYEFGKRVEAHAIGDRAFEVILEALELEPHLPRPVITHCQILNGALVDKIKKYNQEHPTDRLIANIQPQFGNSDLPVIAKRLGTGDRVKKYSYVWKSLSHEMGCVTAGGSDAPVEMPHAIQGLADLIKNVVHPDGEQDLTISEALACYTLYGAYACAREDRIGRIAPDYYADFVLTDLNALGELIGYGSASSEGKAEMVASVIRQTYVGGTVVYDRNAGKEASDRETLFCELVTTGPNGPGKSGRPLWKCPCCM